MKKIISICAMFSLILYVCACQKSEDVLEQNFETSKAFSTNTDSIDTLSVQEVIYWTYMSDSSLITEEEALRTLEDLMQPHGAKNGSKTLSSMTWVQSNEA